MIFLILVAIFLLGTIVGSFLNVVILRYGTGLPIFAPKARSRCPSCGKTLGAGELVPIVSFTLQKGRCKGCRAKISWQYPIAEALTGVIFLLIFLKLDYLLQTVPLEFAYAFMIYAAIWSILIIITFYDLKHKIIPDALVYTFSILSLIATLSLSGAVYTQDLLAGPIFFAFFYALWYFSQGTWLGLGDGKLALGMGLLLGLAKGTTALVLSFWIGAAVSVALIILGHILKDSQDKNVLGGRLREVTKNLTMKSEIPFAPFLIIGTFLAFFCEVDFFGFSLLI